MRVEVHKLNERLRAYVEFSVPLSVELIPRFFMPFFAKLFSCSRPQRSWPFQINMTRMAHGCPIIENTGHVEITKMGRLKFDISILNEKFELLKSLSRFDLAKKKIQDLSLMSSRSLIGFCWKESISGRIIPRGGSSLRVYGPVAHLQIGK